MRERLHVHTHALAIISGKQVEMTISCAVWYDTKVRVATKGIGY